MAFDGSHADFCGSYLHIAQSVCVWGGGGGGGGMYTMYMYMLYVHILYVGGGGGCVAFGRVTMQAQKLLAHNHP